MTTASHILKEAARILEERGKLRDKPDGERSMSRAVAAYQTLRGTAMENELDGWLFLCVLKLARATAGQGHVDDYQDLAGYAALAGECLAAQANGFVPMQEYFEKLEAAHDTFSEIREFKIPDPTPIPDVPAADVKSYHDFWIHRSKLVDAFYPDDPVWPIRVKLRAGRMVKGRKADFSWDERGDENDIVAYQYV